MEKTIGSVAVARKKSTSPVAQYLNALWNQRFLYFLLIPGIIYFIIFKYKPMYGIIIAFQDYMPGAGFLDGPWVGLKHFERLVSSSSISMVVVNTLRISLLKLIFGFPAPIILALLLNEISSQRFKRVIQTVSYLPHFLSWVVISGLVFQILSPSYGIYGLICELLNMPKGIPLGENGSFLTVLILSDVWKEVGYGTVIYLAAIAGIGMEMYEAARIDGASRLQQALYITFPSLAPTIIILFILRLGHVLDAGFDQVFNLYNLMVYEVADIIDTFVYRIGLGNFEYSFSTAVGLTKSVIAFILVMASKQISDRFSDRTAW